jgi:preprotein translocase SecE subunit
MLYLTKPRGAFKNGSTMITSLISYFKGVAQELTHVRWPSQRLSIAYTVLVIMLSIVLAAYTGVLDTIFTTLIDQLI